MGKDAFGNYIADIGSVAVVPGGLGFVLSGNGAPSDSNGTNGSIYVDLLTGTVYQKSGGSWATVSGGGGGVTQVFSFDGNPIGNITASGNAICLGKGSTLGQVWQKTTAGNNNTDWVNIIGP